MDTSETYIKMCEKAGEIQGNWHKSAKEGDYYHVKGQFHAYNIISPRAGYHTLPYLEEYCIWLPRQDQLQEMVVGGVSHKVWMIQRFNKLQSEGCPTDPFTSMEQLWLAFVMKEKYNKVWSGEEWR